MPSPYDAARLNSLGHEWIAAWNARDLDRVPHIHAMGFDPSGTLRGKPRIREYWATALARLPDLHFELIDLFVSPDSVVVFYENERGKRICEYLRFDAHGKIAQASGNYGVG
jgi:ketosteroid isomerase-like protein